MSGDGGERVAGEEAPLERESEASDIDKLREVLFGNQLRDHDRRYARLEERIQCELTGLRNDLCRRIETLEQHLRSELSAASERQQQEAQDRQAAVSRLTGDLLKAERELRSASLDLSKELLAEIQHVHELVSAEVAADVRLLEDGKVDRTQLASLFGELVMRLNVGPEPGLTSRTEELRPQ